MYQIILKAMLFYYLFIQNGTIGSDLKAATFMYRSTVVLTDGTKCNTLYSDSLLP